MAARKGARWLAPIALAASIAAIYILAHRELGPKHGTTAGTAHRTLDVSTRAATRAPASRRLSTFYVVKSGDTLSGIAAKTHVSLGALEALNPKINPSALQTGQRLVLRRG